MINEFRLQVILKDVAPLGQRPNLSHGLPREAGGRQKRLLGAQVGFSTSGPPASAWAVSVASRALVWETRHPPIGLGILCGWSQVPNFEHRRTGLCQKCARRGSPIVLTVSSEATPMRPSRVYRAEL